MMYRSRRAVKKARTTELRRKDTHNGCDSTNGHDFELSCTEMLALDAQKRPAKFSHVIGTKHKADPSRIEGPLFDVGP